MIDILTSSGPKTIHLRHFPALDGWDIQHRFLEFAASTDKDLRRAYIMEVLSYAEVDINGSPLSFVSAALVNNHLETWQNIEAVFEGVLRKNGIDPETHVDKPRFWAKAGEEMATAFLAACSALMEPAMRFASEHAVENKVDSRGDQGGAA